MDGDGQLIVFLH